MPQAQCDIIIPVFNRLDLTERCLKSIGDNTEKSLYHLILIDNGSSQDTQAFLNGFKASRDNVTIVRNEENLGWVKAVNQGMRLSTNPFICLMNNDTVVRTNGWLSMMMDIASSESDIGLVNPNFRLKRDAAGDADRFVEIDFCRGYCVLVKRAVIDRIGLLDESYGLGYYDDDDFSVRAIRAGFRCVRANDAYVEHLGDSTFSRVFKDDKRMALHEKNKRLFYSRWGRRLKVAFIVTDGIDRDVISDLLFSIARRQHIIYLWTREAGLSLPHINIRLRRLPALFYRPFLFLHMYLNRMKRASKRYDLVFTDDSGLTPALATAGVRSMCADMRKDARVINEAVDSAAKA